MRAGKQESKQSLYEMAPLEENPFQDARQEPLSTFSIDVDTASYSKVRIGIKGREIRLDKRLPSNLVFLLDKSYPRTRQKA